MFGQSTPNSYHTEANGCIFFAAAVEVDIVKGWELRPFREALIDKTKNWSK